MDTGAASTSAITIASRMDRRSHTLLRSVCGATAGFFFGSWCSGEASGRAACSGRGCGRLGWRAAGGGVNFGWGLGAGVGLGCGCR